MNLKEQLKKAKEMFGELIDAKALLKKIAEKFIVPKLQDLKVKIAKGEIDLVKGTDIDAKVLMKACDVIIAKVLAEVSEENLLAAEKELEAEGAG